MARVGIIGKDGRTSAIIRALNQSRRVDAIRVLSDWKGKSGRAALAEVIDAAKEFEPDYVIIGPEEPLANGVADKLRDELGVFCVGPTKLLAGLESSKSFTRALLTEYGIPGNPKHRVFSSACTDIPLYLRQLGEFVIKPDGLTSGKGVKVSGVHVGSIEEGVDYCESILKMGSKVIIEERLEGEEFSLQSFCDGTHVVDMPVVQDHKRAFDGDVGPNTGGMGSYSCANHSLPFLTREHVRVASQINAAVAEAVRRKLGEPYLGVLYGGFMATRDGVRLIEYNARFGDPEALNVLSLLESDFGELCETLLTGRLDEAGISFKNLATVCKYVVPDGYPNDPVKGESIPRSALPAESEELRVYLAAVEESGERLYLTGSRAIAFVGISPSLDTAANIAESAAAAVPGRVYHRRDIGSSELIKSKTARMRNLLEADEIHLDVPSRQRPASVL